MTEAEKTWHGICNLNGNTSLYWRSADMTAKAKQHDVFAHDGRGVCMTDPSPPPIAAAQTRPAKAKIRDVFAIIITSMKWRRAAKTAGTYG